MRQKKKEALEIHIRVGRTVADSVILWITEKIVITKPKKAARFGQLWDIVST